MITADTISRTFPATQELREQFLDSLRTNGEVYINYLMGATLHYVMQEFIVCEKDWQGSLFGCCSIFDEERLFDTWIDLQGVASVTPYNIMED